MRVCSLAAVLRPKRAPVPARLPVYGADGDEDDARRKPAHPRSSVLEADGEAQRSSACPHNNVCNTPEQPLRFCPTEPSRRESEEWAKSRCRCGMGRPSLSSSRRDGGPSRSLCLRLSGSSVASVNATDRSLGLAPSGVWGSIESQQSWHPEQQATPEPSGEGYRQQTGTLASWSVPVGGPGRWPRLSAQVHFQVASVACKRPLANGPGGAI
jgi:hypothetical protein